MARHIHETLYYERRGVLEAQHQLNALNEIIWEIQKELGKVFIKEKVWTWGLGIQFRDTSSLEYGKVKELLNNFGPMGKMEKNSSQYGLELEGLLNTGTLKMDNKNDKYETEMKTTVRFKWGIPDTCVIKDVETIKAASDEYYTGTDGEIYRKITERVVECTQPFLESVFTEDVSHSERAN